jgi:hypothetical protein
MSARPYEPSDAPALDRLLDSNQGHDVRLDHDRILVHGSPVSGLLVWRPTAVIHELILPRTLGLNAVARDLVAFACEDAQRSLHRIRIASFMIDPDNLPMVRYVRGLGVIEERRQLYTIPVAKAKLNIGSIKDARTRLYWQ